MKNLLEEKLKKRIKRIYYNTSHKITEFIKWHRRYYSLKYPFVISFTTRIIINILLLLLCGFGVFTFMYKLQILIYIDDTLKINIRKSFENISMTSFVTSQVSLTLIVVSISSLISSIENKYIYGKHAVNLIFHKRGLFSFKVFFLFLFILTFTNIYLLLNDISDALIIIDFVFSMFLVALFVYRFANIFVGQELIKKNLEQKYYKQNLKLLKQARPLNQHSSRYVNDFKNVTIQYIRDNNMPMYNENIEVYFKLLHISLFKNKEKIQEYYTELILHDDFIAQIAIFSQTLLNEGNKKEGLIIYNRILQTLNYYRVINISSFEIYHLAFDYIKCIKYIETDRDMLTYLYLINEMIDNMLLQVYLYSYMDLSYCRLAKSNQIHFMCDGSFWEQYYLSLYKNKYINFSEESQIYLTFFNSVLLTEHNEKFPLMNNDDFLSKKRIHENKDHYPVEIKSEPISLLILKMIEKKDKNNIINFFGMRLSSKLKSAVNSLVILAVTEMLYRDNNRTYNKDLIIDRDFVIETFKYCKVMDLSIELSQMIMLYKMIIDKYTFYEGHSVKGGCYDFPRRIQLSKPVVDTFFLNLAERKNIFDEFIKSVGTKSVQRNTKVDSIICQYI